MFESSSASQYGTTTTTTMQETTTSSHSQHGRGGSMATESVSGGPRFEAFVMTGKHILPGGRVSKTNIRVDANGGNGGKSHSPRSKVQGKF